MITYLGDPLRATHKVSGDDMLIIALQGNGYAVVVGSGGDLSRPLIADLNMNWRFNDKTRKWVDVDTGDEFEGFDETK